MRVTAARNPASATVALPSLVLCCPQRCDCRYYADERALSERVVDHPAVT